MLISINLTNLQKFCDYHQTGNKHGWLTKKTGIPGRDA